MPRLDKTALFPRPKPESRPRDFGSDLAAAHARALLRACGHTGIVEDRVDALAEGREWADSGAMALTGSADGPPRFIPGALASAARGVERVLRALAPGTALVQLDGPALLGERAALVGLERQGERAAGGHARLLATRDGYLVLNLARDDDERLLPAWLETDADLGESKAKTIARIVSTRDTAPLVSRGRLMGLAVAPAPTSVPSDRPLFALHHPSERSPEPRSRRIRLLDLTSLWAGPLATSLLSQTGIDVLKIENPTRPDGARTGSRAFFDLMNEGKRGCALDLHEARDRTRFERLLDLADIVVESARPRALAQLGYDAEGWVRAGPGRLWTSITGYGRAHEWIAYGDDAAVAAGLAWSPDPEVDGPVFPADALADPLTGLHTAAIVLAHLQSGRGGLLDIALHDVAAHAGAFEVETARLRVQSAEGAHARNGSVAGDGINADSPHGWIIDGADRIAISAPRARSIRAVAPALETANERSLAAWMAAC